MTNMTNLPCTELGNRVSSRKADEGQRNDERMDRIKEIARTRREVPGKRQRDIGNDEGIGREENNEVGATREPTPRSQRKRIRPVSFLKYMLLPITILLMLAQASTPMPDQEFQVIPLEQGTHIYYEDIGTAYIQEGKVRLINTLTAQQLNQDKQTVEEVLGNFTKVYDYYDLDDFLLQRIRETANEALDYMSYLDNQEATSKTKRYLFGKVLQFFFGVNEEVYDDIAELARHEELLKTNQAKLHQVILQTFKDQEENQRLLKNKTLELSKMINHTLGDINFGINAMQDDITMLFHYMKASFIIERIAKRYKDLIEPSLTQRIMNLKQNMTQLRMTRSTKITHTVSKESFTSIIEHGLYRGKPYHLVKITPIPHTVNGTVKIPDLNGNYLAYKHDTHEYFTLTEDEFNRCTREQDFIHVCSPNHILNYSVAHCAMAGIFHNEEAACKYREIAQHQLTLKRLLTQNAWIYSATQPANINITCVDSKQSITISNTGVLRISQRCHLEVNSTTIISTGEREVSMLGSFIQHKYTGRTRHVTKIAPIQLDIKLLKHHEEFDLQPIERFKMHEHWSMIWALALSGTLGATLWVVLYFWKQARKRRRTATIGRGDAAIPQETIQPTRLRYSFQDISEGRSNGEKPRQEPDPSSE